MKVPEGSASQNEIQTGNLVYLTSESYLNIMNSATTTCTGYGGGDASRSAYIPSSDAGFVAMNTWHDLRIEATDYTYSVFLDGVKYLEWTDCQSRYGYGYIDLETYCGTASFDSVAVYEREQFDNSGARGWASSSSDWSVSRGELVLGNTLGTTAFTLAQTTVADFEADFDVRITACSGGGSCGSSNTVWGGATFRKDHSYETFQNSGYLVQYYPDGDVCIWTNLDGTVYCWATGISPYPVSRRLHVSASGYTFTLSVDGQQLTPSWTDTHSRWRSGYADLAESGATSHFNFMQLY